MKLIESSGISVTGCTTYKVLHFFQNEHIFCKFTIKFVCPLQNVTNAQGY